MDVLVWMLIFYYLVHTKDYSGLIYNIGTSPLLDQLLLNQLSSIIGSYPNNLGNNNNAPIVIALDLVVNLDPYNLVAVPFLLPFPYLSMFPGMHVIIYSNEDLSPFGGSNNGSCNIYLYLFMIIHLSSTSHLNSTFSWIPSQNATV